MRFDFDARRRQSFADTISRITGIPYDYLLHISPCSSASTAQKMSWAAGRNATRAEDVAYSLLGLFDINMPLLYGEGTKAFMRLQQEVIRTSDDESIFTWRTPCRAEKQPKSWSETCAYRCTREGILAPDPSFFANCGRIVCGVTNTRLPVSITNKGLAIHSEYRRVYEQGLSIYIIPLQCFYESSDQTTQRHARSVASSNAAVEDDKGFGEDRALSPGRRCMIALKRSADSRAVIEGASVARVRLYACGLGGRLSERHPRKRNYIWTAEKAQLFYLTLS